MLHDIMLVCIIKHNMIIEEKFDTHRSILDLNMMLVPKVHVIGDKIEQFQWFVTRHK